MKIFERSKLQKKYIAFFTLVPLVGITAIVNASCPVCEGEGFVYSNPEMEFVQIIDIETTELGITRDTCGMFLIYNYNIILSVENSGSGDAVGWLLMYLIDFKDGKIVSQQYTVIEIPGNTSWDVEYEISFAAGHDEPRRTEVQAKLLRGEVPCETCDGSGGVSLNTWPVVNVLKENFRQLQYTPKPWAPPEWPVDHEGQIDPGDN